MGFSRIFMVAMAVVLFFSFVVNNLDYIFELLNLDAIKLNQTIDFVQARNNQLTDIDLINLEID